MRKRGGLRVTAVIGSALTVAVLVGVLVSIASAELTSSGNLFITFNGGIKPAALPRGEPAPITVWMDGRVRILSGEQPPSATTMTVKLNRNGRLDTRGLPTCRIGELQARTSQEAMEECGDALVGSGTYRARLDFSNEGPTPSHGKILAFNGRHHGRPAVLAQVHSSAPAISTDIIVFDITHPASGPFGTVLTGTVPPGLSRWGYLKHVSLTLHREYTYKGQSRSYLSAPCPAPAGVHKAAFPFVFASIAFDDGRVLSSTLTRTCTVRGG